jgi:LuxR family maltose regulon positive regulatory protein
LIDRLHASIGHGLVLLHAPAGFGKTTLLAQFAADVDYSVRWLALDGSCAVPEVFAERIGAALLGETPFPAPSAVGRTGDLKAYLAAAMARASAESAEPVLLIFDNAHELGADESTVDLLGWLLEAAPEGMEVVLAGRELPPLTALDARIATGEAVLLGSAELAFNEDEIAAACARRPSGFSPAHVFGATDGWPVGVMAILSGTVAPETSLERRQGAAWERYLATQVWESVPEPLRPSLLRLSLPPVIAGADAIRRTSGAAWLDLSRWLSGHDFLYEALPGECIRLNPLLRSFLREEFRRTSPGEFDSALGELIAQAERESHIADAIELARAPGQEQRLADVLEHAGPRLIHQGAFALLERGFELVPASLVEERALLAAIRARVFSHTGRPFEALDAADILLDGASVRGVARIHATLARLRALRMLGKNAELLECIGQMRAIGDCEDQAVLGELTYQEAEIALSVQADFPRAERLLRQTIEQCDAAHVQLLGLLAASSLGQLQTMRGDAPGAVTTLTKAAQGWRSVGRSSNLGWVLNNLGMAHLQVGDFESAVRVLEEARAEGIQCENQRNVAYATASLGDAELALGHWQRAKEQYEEAIRICAEEAPDETLAALSIAGLSAALLGLDDLQQADFFVKRAVLVAVASGNSYEVATCKLQQAAVESATGNHVSAIATAREAVALFEAMETRTSLAVACYRLALCCFRAGRRNDAQQTLREMGALMTEPWMTGALLPLVRENPMFAQWAASRNLAGSTFRELIERLPFGGEENVEPVEAAPARFPAVVAKSLGPVAVSVGTREVTEEAWSSARAKELFFLFLANRSGLRKEEAVAQLYPELSAEKCNSAFHSNLYRLRKALFQDSVIKRDGDYLLNPEATFIWDVDQFEETLSHADRLPLGTRERAEVYQRAMGLYRGPFAEAFDSEWAESLRQRLELQSQRALSVLAGYFAGRDDFGSAAACMEQVLRGNRLNEEAAYSLATYRTKAGQPVAALAFIDGYRRTYEAEFGEQVPERFLRLRASIASGAGA